MHGQTSSNKRSMTTEWGVCALPAGQRTISACTVHGSPMTATAGKLLDAKISCEAQLSSQKNCQRKSGAYQPELAAIGLWPHEHTRRGWRYGRCEWAISTARRPDRKNSYGEPFQERTSHVRPPIHGKRLRCALLAQRYLKCAEGGELWLKGERLSRVSTATLPPCAAAVKRHVLNAHRGTRLVFAPLS